MPREHDRSGHHPPHRQRRVEHHTTPEQRAQNAAHDRIIREARRIWREAHATAAEAAKAGRNRAYRRGGRQAAGTAPDMGTTAGSN
jgi:hypothetical protein